MAEVYTENNSTKLSNSNMHTVLIHTKIVTQEVHNSITSRPLHVPALKLGVPNSYFFFLSLNRPVHTELSEMVEVGVTESCEAGEVFLDPASLVG